jgi:hypothetical protein
VLFDQPGCPDGISGGQRMANGLVGQPVLLAPAGRGPVQPSYPLGLGLGEAGAEQVGEQLVVAPLAAHLVQRMKEQIRPLGLLQ